MEIWKDIKNYEGHYQVSNYGNVRSIKTHKNKVLKQLLTKNECYYHVSLCLNSKHHPIRIHTLVADAFLGERPNGMVVDHIDQNKLNNNINNLRYVTYSKNAVNTKPNINNKTGTIGVYFNIAKNKYISYITVNYNRKHLGSFENIEDAIKCRKDAELLYFNLN